MGNFEKNIPMYIGQLEAEMGQLSRQKYDLDWGHECDCEFCDESQDIPEGTQETADELEAQIKSKALMITRLKEHARIHGIIILDNQKRDNISIMIKREGTS